MFHYRNLFTLFQAQKTVDK